jgi:glycosyltransferase involved in cell wall biosynthesis
VPIRIILVDDGSTDGSGAICDRYSREHGNVTVIHRENGGTACAKNTGIEQADTAYIGFADSDD